MSKKNNGTTFRLTAAFTEFVKSETSGGIVLLICTAVALAWANSSWSNGYFHLWESPLSIGIGQFSLTKTLIHWINDGLMVIFFFFVGLEIKREIVIGELSSVKKAMLPIIAALGGMIGPALIFLAFNGSDPV
ncbi:MAG: Na+/H+ antiporter NhaA, partial [Bacteroidota bacterium]